MLHETKERRTFGQRLVLFVTAVVLATLGWFVLGESESVVAEEAAGGKALATVAGKPVFQEDVYEKIAGQLLALDRQRHELITDAVLGEVEDRLIEAEAEKRGVDTDALLRTEVEAKASALAQEEIDAFYEEHKKQRGGRVQPKEQVEPQIRNHLAYVAFLDRLRKAYPVETMIEPFRVDVAAVGPAKGPAEAPVTIVEFSDFECPYCSRVTPGLDKVHEVYGDKVRIVFRQFPLEQIHPNARRAARAALCAHDQGHFWGLHDAMFADQQNLAGPGLLQIAGKVEGLDATALAECLTAGTHEDTVDRDLGAGERAGVTGTPALFINGRFVNGAAAFEQLATMIDEELGRGR